MTEEEQKNKESESTASLDELVEVYRCTGLLEVERAVVEVLEPMGIACMRRDRQSHALPAPGTLSGAWFVAVPAASAEEARKVLHQAIGDHILDGDHGQVID